MTTPNYNPQIPQPTDTIADSRSEYFTNFSTLFDAFGRNHVNLNDSTNPGNHNIAELVQQTISRTTADQEIAFYTKNVADQTTQLFMRYPLNGSEFQISQYQIFELPIIPGLQRRFFSFLPGGIIVYFGFVIPNQDSFPIDLTPAICSNITGVNLCPIGTSTISNPLYQSNVNLMGVGGKFTNVILNNSTTFSTPPPQYYLIFGNV